MLISVDILAKERHFRKMWQMCQRCGMLEKLPYCCKTVVKKQN